MELFLYEDTGINIDLNTEAEIAPPNQSRGGGATEDEQPVDFLLALKDDDGSELVRMFAPTPGIEGTDIGSGG